MTTTGTKRRRAPRKKSSKVTMQPDLAERIVKAGEESYDDTVPEIERGPLGNADYVPHGSEAHKVLLGIDPETGETVFDLTGIDDKAAERFVAQRERMLEGVPTAPPGCPEAWNPDAPRGGAA